MKSDMELNTLASGGRALQGMTLVPEQRPTGRRKEALLNPPRDVPLTDVAATAACSVACCFSRPEESAAFCDDVMEMGWSAAFLMHEEKMLWCVSDCKGSQQWDKHAHNPGKLTSTKVSEACITYCVYAPMKSFQIPKGKMELCEAVLQSASMVQSHDDAEGFFEMYNSHLSQNLYHLGGVFLREVIYKWREEISLPDLMTQALQTIRGSMQQDETFSPSRDCSGLAESTCKGLMSSKVNQRIETITALGPTNAKGEADFQSQLHENPRCWSIIDKEMDGKEHLVGVWELLDSYAHWLATSDAMRLKRAAQLLCECWYDRVMGVVPEAQTLCLPVQSAYLYYELLHQNSFFVANLSSDPMFMEQFLPAPPPGPHNNEDVAMVLALTQHLQSLADEAERFSIEADMASEAVRWITFSLDRSQVLTRKSAELQRALDVLKDYGFDVHGQHKQPEFHLDKLRGMILDLREICEPKKLLDFSQALQGGTFPSHGSTSKIDIFRYMGDVVVDRSFYQSPSTCESGCSDQYGAQHDVRLMQYAACRQFIDCLRHHVNPLKYLHQAQSHSSAATEDDWDSAFKDEDNEDAIEASEAMSTDDWDSAFDEGHEDVMRALSMQTYAPGLQDQPAMPFELLIQIMQESDLPLQVALTKLLLFQRAAAPLVFPSIKHAENVRTSGELPLTHSVQAFCFWEVSLAKEQKLCIASDTSLPRVFFLSSKRVQDAHTAVVASRVLHCDFLSQHGHCNVSQVITPAIEVGIGFLSSRDSGFACLSFLVTGPYQQIMGFAEAVADIIILEMDQGVTEHEPLTKSVKVLQWQETDARKFSDKRNMMIWGQESYVVGEIQSFLSKAFQRKMPKRREGLKEVCAAHFVPHQLISFEELQGMLGHCDFATAKKSLKLQRSFLQEAQAHFDVLQLKDNPNEKRTRALRCQQERRLRSRLATEVRNHAMLQVFCKILVQPDATSRRLAVMWLEKTISEMMCPLLEEAMLRIDSSFEAWQRNSKDRRAKENYISAKQDYIEKNLRMDNLWRELCHLYEADPLKQRHLAKQAAQHLLDGFPIEVLDGDAGVFCKTWVESVLVELDVMTRRQPDSRAARIFVLSVMGLQSSGKSTVLNLMFGTQLQTSAGRCTRGVYMQLVPSERAEYDYVMLLDTEGIRSPEHFGLRSSEAHDNRIATFGLLPADASIFMVSNEDDSGLKEVLPMVLLAFKGSAMAESCGGRIKAKMVFVYRSVDTNDKKKLKGNREKLQEYLREAAEQVANIRFFSGKEGNVAGCSTDYEDQSGSDLLQTVFTEFRVDKDEGKSDVKCMGSLKKACVPPDDTPDWAYGEQVIELREYIHRRVIEGGWKATGFVAWAEHLTRVWDCVCSADFELSFRSAIEYSAYRDLQAKLRPLRTELCQKYLDEFEALEQHVRTMSVEESFLTLFDILEKNVEDVVRSKRKELESILATKVYANWRAGELDNWNQFCVATKEWYKRRIEDMESGIVKFEKVVTNYERQIKEMIMQKMDNGDWSMMYESEETRNHKFDELFESILHMAKEIHPPISERVSNNVLDRYKQHGLGKKFDLYAKRAIVADEPRNWVQRLFSGYGGRQQIRISKQQELQFTLQTVIDQQLRDARQYSEVLVDNVILQTTRVLERQGLGNADQEAAHIWVKQTLTARMEEIQRHWDNEHNVVEKLRSKAKPRLYRFFKARAEGLEAASLLIKELQSMFEDELEEVHSQFVVKKVAAQLGHAEWVMDWKVMRDCLDLQLLALTEKKSKKNTDLLLRFVSDGSAHFQELTSGFIRHAITPEMWEQEWEALVQRLETCLNEESSANMTVDTFLVQLSKRLSKHVDAKLANAVASSIHHDYFKDHILDGDFYQQKVPEMCKSLRKRKRPDFEIVRVRLIERVRERMVQREDESCRPRCDARCPLCGITCFHSAGHVGKHDSIHQPAGLRGMHHVSSLELDAKSCLDSLNEGWLFRLGSDGDFIPYQNFSIEFPSWVNPSKNEKIATEVREYIFFNYQDELVSFHSMRGCQKKQCPAATMPSQYNHDAQCLRAGLYNRLRPIFQDSGACNDALLVLQSI